MQDQILSMLVDQNEVSWRSIIQDLVRSEKMDPWNVDLTLLSKEYIGRVRQMQRMDLKVGGKVVLAASLLLKLKSNKLVGEDLLEFDRLLAPPEDDMDFYEDLQMEYDGGTSRDVPREKESFPLYPRSPQPRRRKVSVFDLLEALEKALEVKQRRENKLHAVSIQAPEKKVDIGVILKDLFARIKGYFGKKQEVTFDTLLDTRTKEEKVLTFIPLLYLTNEKKIDLQQDGHFGDIRVVAGENINAN